MAKVGRKRGVAQGGKKKKQARRDVVVGEKKKENGTKLDSRRGDEELLSSEDEDELEREEVSGADREEEEEDEEAHTETADEKRLRLARAYLQKLKDISNGTKGEDDEEDGDIHEGREDRTGERDSLVADLLKQQQLEESGRFQRKLASRVLEPSLVSEGRHVSRRHRQSVTTICITEDDSRGFAASKDGLIVHWDIETGTSEKYSWPALEPSTSGSGGSAKAQLKQHTKKPASKHMLALAVSYDGRYLTSGGLDREIHLWDTRTREHLQAFPGHRNAISSLVFRQGTQQLMSGSFDRTIKLWSIEDRSYIDTLYGHQSEVLAIDCLRQERLLSAGRDRTLRIWKVPEETQLVFRGHAASMDSCCFLSNSEFLSGSDDGCLALWNTARKKPVCLVKNAHGSSITSLAGQSNHLESTEMESIVNELQNGHSNGTELVEISGRDSDLDSVSHGGAATSWVGAVAVCRGSDLAASAGGDGVVRLWALEDTNRSLRALHGLPVKGFVNSLAFAHSGRFILAGVGQEPRLGRWGQIPHVRNGIVQHMINLS